ncbi:MAG: hypothetical protein K0Q73_4722, partial [Paenibacillus sp.]|nr:hypothetical protein [Paenibacillus sp.]
MTESSILAYFKSPEQAEAALARLQSLRIVDSSIDRIDGYPGEGSDPISVLNGDFPGLGALTLGGDFPDRNAGILAAASVSASGMSSGGPDNQVTGYDILLTVVLNKEDHEKAT